MLGDGAKGITVAKDFEFPNCRRLTCWAHAIRKIREHRKMLPIDKWKTVEADILTLQLSFCDAVFDKGASLLLHKWRSDPDLFYFSNYFEQTWLSDLKLWYEGAAIGHPSTNNGLESLNNKIKQQFTLINKLCLSKFLSTMEMVLREWLTKTIEDDFQTFPKINTEIEKLASKWRTDLNKVSIVHWYGHSYIVPSSKSEYYPASWWLHEDGTLPWTNFNDFSRWLFSGRLVTLPKLCSCRTNLKTFVCEHAIGLSIHFGLYTISDPSKFQNLNRRRGRPKKARLALAY